MTFAISCPSGGVGKYDYVGEKGYLYVHMWVDAAKKFISKRILKWQVKYVNTDKIFCFNLE